MKSKRPIIYKTEEDKKRQYQNRKEYNTLVQYAAIKKYQLKESKAKQDYYNNNEEFRALSEKMKEIFDNNNLLVKLRDNLREKYIEYAKKIADYHKEFNKLRKQRKILRAKLIKEYANNKKNNNK